MLRMKNCLYWTSASILPKAWVSGSRHLPVAVAADDVAAAVAAAASVAMLDEKAASHRRCAHYWGWNVE